MPPAGISKLTTGNSELPTPVADNPWIPPMSRRLKIGRNDPCFCGSGLKFKKCHLEELGKAVPALKVKSVARVTPTFGNLRIAPPEIRDEAMRLFQEQRRKE